ncbi:MAG: HhoA/HhoB/HtrA family serine endopeptidase [Xenococcaceae cyanobacterium MO_207.B15]|nr:HhoA/HhoB/HtrA family serine endopeptidase [Xenococcaceae cyanobacterium MO_207.B15]
MSSIEQQLRELRQASIYGLVMVLSFAATIPAIQAFPTQLVPGYSLRDTLMQLPTSNFSLLSQTPIIEQIKHNKHNFVVAAVKRVGAAVVRINTERTITIDFPAPFFDDPFFRRFFGEDIFPRLPREYRQQGQGSGFIIDSDGIVLTNAHVVSRADTVMVTLKDGRTFQGEVRGIDELSDLAVVKIQGRNLPVAPLGNSSEVQVGDWAIAVGNPLGLDNTVTLGIISTLKRSSSQVGIPDKRLDFIQTDAAINPGNSGGPLLNERGEVIGINTAIRAKAEGIGFAIPIDTAKAIKDQLARGEKIPHPYIGIRMLNLTPEIAKEINRIPNAAITVPEIRGVLVVQVIPNSPAMVAGLRRGDVIVAIEGRSVTKADKLQDIVAKSSIGRELRLKVQRGDQIQQLSVYPEELQEAQSF